MNPREVAGLASTRTYPLRSSFRPSYNMAVNLVDQFGRETSRELLEQSFAQFQADKAVVGLARQLRKAEDALAGYAEAAHCELGDFMEYAGLRRRITEVEKGASKAKRADLRVEAIESLRHLKPWRRDRGADREVRRLRRGRRPGLGRGQPTPVRRDRRPAGAASGIDRLPGAGRLARAGQGAEVVQRAQPADAPRPRLRAALAHARPGAPAAGQEAVAEGRLRPSRRP